MYENVTEAKVTAGAPTSPRSPPSPTTSGQEARAGREEPSTSSTQSILVRTRNSGVSRRHGGKQRVRFASAPVALAARRARYAAATARSVASDDSAGSTSSDDDTSGSATDDDLCEGTATDDEGHPVHSDGAVRLLPAHLRTPWGGRALAALRPADIAEAERLLGEACTPSINRLRRRIGMLARLPPPPIPPPPSPLRVEISDEGDEKSLSPPAGHFGALLPPGGQRKRLDQLADGMQVRAGGD